MRRRLEDRIPEDDDLVVEVRRRGVRHLAIQDGVGVAGEIQGIGHDAVGRQDAAKGVGDGAGERGDGEARPLGPIGGQDAGAARAGDRHDAAAARPGEIGQRLDGIVEVFQGIRPVNAKLPEEGGASSSRPAGPGVNSGAPASVVRIPGSRWPAQRDAVSEG
jgi:hypothetical protein